MYYAVLLAGGSGKRMANAASDKVLAPLLGNDCSLSMCLSAFDTSGSVGHIIITFRDEQQRLQIENVVKTIAPRCSVTYTQGGNERAHSVLAALECIPAADDDSLVFIHDSARPLVTAKDIQKICEIAEINGASALAHPVTDTIKRRSSTNMDTTLEDVPRAQLNAMETPQVFHAKVIRDAYKLAINTNAVVTDDAAAAALTGVHPILFDPKHPNPKLTTPADLDWIRYLLSKPMDNHPNMNDKLPLMRIGYGYDIHRFALGRRLVLGGVEIAHDKGLDGHSDADCLCHAIADAILGAAGLPDIGHYYPPGQAVTKDMNSLEIVSGAVARAAEQGLKVGNIDTTLIAREPKIAPHVPAMKEKLAAALGIPADRIGIKATTNEGIDGLGRGEGIAANAVAMLYTTQY